MLLAKGNEHKLELPPLFQKEFIDHGALTNANEKSADIKEGLQEFMDYIEMFDLYDLLVPTSNHLGYRIDSTDARIPQNIKAAIYKCTKSTTFRVNKKTVRSRFLDIKSVSPELAKELKTKLAAVHTSYEKWAVATVEKWTNFSKQLKIQFSGSFYGVTENVPSFMCTVDRCPSRNKSFSSAKQFKAYQR